MTKADHSSAPVRVPFSALPDASGLYDPRFEHDACGVSFVVDVKGAPSRDDRRRPRSARSATSTTGAPRAPRSTPATAPASCCRSPTAFLRAVVDFALPPAGAYGVGLAFLPLDADRRREDRWPGSRRSWRRRACGSLGWRDVPIDDSMIGPTAQSVMPSFRQLFVDDPDGATGIDARPQAVRRPQALRARDHDGGSIDGLNVYFPSLSSRTLVYKGMLTTPQLGEFFPDLRDERVESALALVHSRFSTNTFPSWPLAHPYRYLAHNGEINTRAGQPQLDARPRGADEHAAHPGPRARVPDHHARRVRHRELRRVPRAAAPRRAARSGTRVLMMIPEAWENHATMSPEKRAFYRYHASLMEPWDGPASIAFTDGTVIGAVLDRNGLRPSRYWVTDDDRVIMASEAGVVDVDPSRVVQEGPAAAGPHVPRRHRARAASSTTRRSRQSWPREHPYGEWLDAGPRAPRRPARPRARRATATSRCCGARRRSATRTRSSSCSSSPMARTGAEAHRLDGHRHAGRGAVRPPAACCSTTSSSCSRRSRTRRSTPSARSWSRRCRRTIGAEGNLLEPEPRVVRAGRAAVPDHRQRRAGQAHPHRRRRRPPRVRRAGDLRPLPGRRRRRRRCARRSTACAPRRRRRSTQGKRVLVLSDRDSNARVGADPVAAAHVGGAPPPDPREDAHEGRPRGRGGRRARSAPHGAADRLRRRRDQPVPRVRVDRGPHRAGSLRPRRRRPARRRSRTTSRRRARACSR